ncbi:hypothetical protein [Paludibaculum fermentans]|uniref:Uncharacterized protein n=1 Tax=Paludibaculum fermentans TaxID=1473598 RepID=A0A7S7SMW6_PALFE|nr:hypothetical protein [Paludibaculum fermentans]QOY90368.1 hypothetical protein IRI77_10550 [Paludibaculum fermentans]
MNKGRASVLLGCLLVLAASGGIRGDGKYNGVVVFDRWGGCHLYGGAYVMEISEQVKGLLRPYADQAVLIDAKEVWQPINPGDGLIRKLAVLGPSEETTAVQFGRPPLLDDLELKVFANFRAASGPELILELKNNGTSKRGVDMDALAPTLLAKRQEVECFCPSDGPSCLAVTRTNINFLHQHPVAGACSVNGRSRTVRLWLSPGVAVQKAFELGPGQSIEVSLQFDLSAGEYEFLAGYGAGVHQSRTLASNRIAFDVDGQGQPHLVGLAAEAATGTRTREACGGIARADVFLWPTPLKTRGCPWPTPLKTPA